jgi:hypothetical protein
MNDQTHVFPLFFYRYSRNECCKINAIFLALHNQVLLCYIKFFNVLCVYKLISIKVIIYFLYVIYFVLLVLLRWLGIIISSSE